MTTYVHRTLITPTDLAPLCRQLTEAVAGLAGAGMFQTPLSADGSLPASHYISAGMIEDTMAALLESPEALHEATAEYTTLEQCEAILAQCDISDEPGQVALARLGLQLVHIDDE